MLWSFCLESMENKKTVVLGASSNPTRYSHLAVQRLSAYGHEVLAIGSRAGQIGKVQIETDPATSLEQDVDTVTLYLHPMRQKAYYDYLLQLSPKRIIFNPGTENMELVNLARNAGIEAEIACTLVMLSTGQY